MSVIVGIGTAVPENRACQMDIADFMVELLELGENEAKRLRLLYQRSAIEYRHTLLPDYTSTKEARKFYPKTSNLEPFPTVNERMQLFYPEARKLAAASADNALAHANLSDQINHVISVTCTGLSAPGLDIDLVKYLDLPSNTYRTSVNFMGCYAAFHGMKHADMICQNDDDAVVLMDCVELCTLHFQKRTDIDHLVANSLFADGSASLVVVSDAYAKKHRLHGIHLDKFYSELAIAGEKDMAWEVGEHGFLMKLSGYIPELVENGIKALSQHAFSHLGIKKNDIDHWAIHPGGRKILEAIEKAMDIRKGDLESSYRILREFGNMSSPTVLFVLKDLWCKIDWSKSERFYSAAFGPGLTLETSVMTAVNHGAHRKLPSARLKHAPELSEVIV